MQIFYSNSSLINVIIMKSNQHKERKISRLQIGIIIFPDLGASFPIWTARLFFTFSLISNCDVKTIMLQKLLILMAGYWDCCNQNQNQFLIDEYNRNQYNLQGCIFCFEIIAPPLLSRKSYFLNVVRLVRITAQISKRKFFKIWPLNWAILGLKRVLKGS